VDLQKTSEGIAPPPAQHPRGDGEERGRREEVRGERENDVRDVEITYDLQVASPEGAGVERRRPAQEEQRDADRDPPLQRPPEEEIVAYQRRYGERSQDGVYPNEHGTAEQDTG
jgi:hypothetical protein